MWKYLTLAASIVLTGCTSAPKTTNDLVELNNSDSFKVESNYQETYRKIKSGFEGCGGFEASMLKPLYVRSDLFTDIQEGRITIYAKGGIAKSFIRISHLDDDHSKVDTFYQWKGNVGKETKTYQRWANGDMTCP